MSDKRKALIKLLRRKPWETDPRDPRDTVSGTANDWNSYDDNNWAGVRLYLVTKEPPQIDPFGTL